MRLPSDQLAPREPRCNYRRRFWASFRYHGKRQWWQLHHGSFGARRADRDGVFFQRYWFKLDGGYSSSELHRHLQRLREHHQRVHSVLEQPDRDWADHYQLLQHRPLGLDHLLLCSRSGRYRRLLDGLGASQRDHAGCIIRNVDHIHQRRRSGGKQLGRRRQFLCCRRRLHRRDYLLRHQHDHHTRQCRYYRGPRGGLPVGAARDRDLYDSRPGRRNQLHRAPPLCRALFLGCCRS